MRLAPVAPLLATLALCAGCDGGIDVSGNVTSSAGEPVADAAIFFADTSFNDEMVAFLDGKSENPYPGKYPSGEGATDEDGTYTVTRIVAGNGPHDFWLVVYKDGFETHSERIWKDTGFPERPFTVDVVLAPTDSLD